MVSLFSIPQVCHDVVMLRVFPITITGVTKGMHLDKECPLTEEVKRVEEVKHGFRRPSANNAGNRAIYHVGPLGYYTRVDNRLPFDERKSSLEETINKHIEESTKRRVETEE
ncbi:hypothetical protein Tco_1292791 [Tanacetum coccineum]